MLLVIFSLYVGFFFFNDTATTEIYTLSLHDALPIFVADPRQPILVPAVGPRASMIVRRSEEHTSELQSLAYLVCRLLLEKKNHTRPGCRRYRPAPPPAPATGQPARR